jgi:hypothetical protein
VINIYDTERSVKALQSMIDALMQTGVREADIIDALARMHASAVSHDPAKHKPLKM